jgi:uncharacterized membrane protein
MPKNFDLAGAMVTVVLNSIWLLLPLHSLVVGSILSFPLIFILPGYTLSIILFHKHPPELPGMFLFSLGLSLTIDILGGLILNMFPQGLQAASWTTLLSALTILFSLGAAYVRRGKQPDRAHRYTFHHPLWGGVLFIISLVIVILSFQYAIQGAEQQPYPGFTQLWIISATQQHTNCAVRLGIRNFEAMSVSYHLVLTIKLQKQLENTTFGIVLAPLKTWQRSMTMNWCRAGPVHIGVQLYRVDRPGVVYRQVALTLPRSR